MSYWIYPSKTGHPIVVLAELHSEAKEKVLQCPEYDGGKLVVVPIEFYEKLCRTGAVGVAMIPFERGTENGNAQR